LFGEGDGLVAVAVDYVQIAGGELLFGDGGELFGGEGAGVDVIALVCEGLAVLDCDAVFGVVAAGGDAVGGVGPAEGDVAVVGTDAGRPAGCLGRTGPMFCRRWR